VIRTELTKSSGSSARAFLAVVAAMLLYLLATHPILARAQSGPDRGDPPAPRVSLPLQVGFFNGATALYITPEVGVGAAPGTPTYATAQQIAKGFNSNFIPQNFATLPDSPAVDDIFVFTNFTQGNVLASAPHPAGPGNTDPNYSPLWQISLVSWNSGTQPRALTSQADIESAASANQVTVQRTPIIVECSVIFTPSGGTLPGARLTGPRGLTGLHEGDK
jgi:hypothetical protein